MLNIHRRCDLNLAVALATIDAAVAKKRLQDETLDYPQGRTAVSLVQFSATYSQ